MDSSSDTGLEWPELHMIYFSQDKYSSIKPSAAVTAGGMIKIDGKIWIPEKDLGPQVSILISAHCGICGHWGSKATASSLMEPFIWKGIDEDCQAFVKACVHYVLSRTVNRVPRPLATILHASRPNEVVHFDFLYMGPSTNEMKFLLVIRGDLSTYMWLCPCTNADAKSAAVSLCLWITAFTVTDMWVSDQASHLKTY